MSENENEEQYKQKRGDLVIGHFKSEDEVEEHQLSDECANQLNQIANENGLPPQELIARILEHVMKNGKDFPWKNVVSDGHQE